MKRLWIKNGRVLDPHSNFDREADVLVERGVIKNIDEDRQAPDEASKGEKIIDAKGCWVVPGLVDIHTHLRDPGFEYKESVASGTHAACHGGFTSIVCMANTNPVNDNASVTEYIMRQAQSEGKARVFPVGSVTIGLEGKTLSEFGDLRDAGAVALSDDGKPVINTEILRHALEYAKNFDLPIISHCEDPHLFKGGCINEGKVSMRLGLKGIPNAAEDIMVSRDIELAALTGGRLHLAHLSTAGSVRFLEQGKDRGVRVSGEVTPHHLLLNEDAVMEYDSNCKMNPPLRSEEDRQIVLKGLKDGVFDAIASDHAPHSIDEKEVEIDRAPFGIIGLETTVSLILTLVHRGDLTAMEAVRLLTIGPAQVLGLDQWAAKGKSVTGVGRLKKGGIADIAIIDPNKKYVIDKEHSMSKSRNTPFHGWEVTGKVRETILGGEVLYAE